MTPTKKKYMKRWRQLNPDKVAKANENFRKTHPDYHRLWKIAHPNYQQLYRQRNPAWRKLWYLRYKSRDPQQQAKRQQFLSSFSVPRYLQFSFLKPNPSEYADFPHIAQQVIRLTGCKYLI